MGRLCFFCLFFLFLPFAVADDAARLGGEISGSLMSPYCPGRTISACPSDKARALRTEITSWAEAGQSREQIVKALEVRYGAEIYGVPEASGVGLLGWTLPAAFVLLGVAILYFILGRAPRVAAETALGSTPDKETIRAGAEATAEIEQEIKRRLLER